MCFFHTTAIYVSNFHHKKENIIKASKKEEQNKKIKNKSKFSNLAGISAVIKKNMGRKHHHYSQYKHNRTTDGRSTFCVLHYQNVLWNNN